jgi:hypothetical protein
MLAAWTDVRLHEVRAARRQHIMETRGGFLCIVWSTKKACCTVSTSAHLRVDSS